MIGVLEINRTLISCHQFPKSGFVGLLRSKGPLKY